MFSPFRSPARLKVAYGERLLRAELVDGQLLQLPLDDAAAGQQFGQLAASALVVSVVLAFAGVVWMLRRERK